MAVRPPAPPVPPQLVGTSGALGEPLLELVLNELINLVADILEGVQVSVRGYLKEHGLGRQLSNLSHTRKTLINHL